MGKRGVEQSIRMLQLDIKEPFLLITFALVNRVTSQAVRFLDGRQPSPSYSCTGAREAGERSLSV